MTTLLEQTLVCKFLNEGTSEEKKLVTRKSKRLCCAHQLKHYNKVFQSFPRTTTTFQVIHHERACFIRISHTENRAEKRCAAELLGGKIRGVGYRDETLYSV